MVFKDSKRPPSDDDLYQLSCKHPRHLDYGNNVTSIPVHEKPHMSGGDGQESFNKSQDEERVINHAVADALVGEGKEFEVSGFGSISSLSWVTSSASKEESRSERGLRISCSPRLVEYDWPARSLIPSEEIFSSLMDYPPRKPVSIGPNHQADVPEWCLDGTETAIPGASNANLDANAVFPQSSLSSGKGSHPALDDSNWDRMAGTCVIPMPAATGPIQCSHVGLGRTDCGCPVVSSVGCVRHHVMEARDKLKETIGQELFMDLGFCEMGEDVAQRWSEEEEQMFHAVVFSNPASSGKNFWDHLLQVFPLRTKKELVSYYFNVFMLRRRAEQNRSHPVNIDSDNDEWQGSDDGGEFAMIEEEDEDSAVEHVVHISEGAAGDCDEDDEDDDDDYDINNDSGNGDVDDDIMSEDDDGGLDDVSEAHVGSTQISEKLSDDFSSISSNKNAGGDPQNAPYDLGVRIDSYTSYECQHSHTDSSSLSAAAVMQESRVEIACNKTLHDEFGNDVTRDPVVDHGYILEPPCKALPGPEKVHVLSMPNMIDEVFGNVAQSENKTKENPHRS
ncbi:hypothetical protein ACLOJK_010894 [Asimina triloba]